MRGFKQLFLILCSWILVSGAQPAAPVFDYDQYYKQVIVPALGITTVEPEDATRTRLWEYLQRGSLKELDRYVAMRQYIYFSRDNEDIERLLSQFQIQPDDFLTLYNKAKTKGSAGFQEMERVFDAATRHKELIGTASTLAYEFAFALVNDKNHIAAIDVLKTGLALFPATDRSRDKLFLMDAMAVILEDTLNPVDMVKNGITLHDEVEAEFHKLGENNAIQTINLNKGWSKLLSTHDYEGALLELDKISKEHFTYQEAILGKGLAYLGLNRPKDALNIYQIAEPEKSQNDSDRTTFLFCVKTLIGFELNREHTLSPCFDKDLKNGTILDVLFIKKDFIKRFIPASEQRFIDAKFQSYFFDEMTGRIQHAMASSVNRLNLIRAKQDAELAQMASQSQVQENNFKTALVAGLSLVILVVLIANLLLKRRNTQIHELNRYIKTRILQRFLPPALIEEIIQGKSRIDEIPQQKTITILFCDLVNFTEASERLGSEKTARLLHQYFDRMSERIFKTQGTIDKFIGDAIMVIFGAPIDQDVAVQVQRAVQCANEMLECLEQLNKEWTREFGLEFAARIGINSGEAIVGSFGSELRSDYTVIGSTVNIASRIEQLAKPNTILVSQGTASHIKPERLESIGKVQLRGINQSQELYVVKQSA